MRDITKCHPRLQEKANDNFAVYIHKVPKELTGYDNDKVYIGITRQKPTLRWQYGNGYKESTYFWHAIQKYGWKNIEHKILMTGLTANEAGMMERELIKKYDSMNPQKGYNLTSGGDNILDSVSVSDVTRERHSILQKRLWRENKEFREKMSGDNCHLHIHKFVFYGKDNVASKKTILLNTGEIFDCQRDGAKKYGVGMSGVHKCCNGKTRYGGKNKELGYLVWMDYEEYLNSTPDIIQKRLEQTKRIYSNSSKRILNTKNQLVYPTGYFLAEKLGYSVAFISKRVRSRTPIDGVLYVYLKEYCEENRIDEDFLLQICEEVW